MIGSIKDIADTRAGALMTRRGTNWGHANREQRISDRGVTKVTDEKELFKSDPVAEWLNHPHSAKPTRQQHHKPKNGNGKTIVIPGDGNPCPRCGMPMEIREHNGIGHKQLRQPYYYTRWFYCTNKSCKTTLVMPERYKVMNPVVRSNTCSDNAKPTVMQPERADANERPPWE
jgi:hypothetical protein